MRFGVVLPQNDIGRDPQNAVRFVRAAEDAGFRYVQVYDHVLGADLATRPGWDKPYDLNDQFHEPFVFFGYLAALTQLELVTGILILPQRQTALVAKQAAEVDILTGGRFRLGVGIGWNDVEYEALGEDFHNRGARMEEQIDVMRRLWTEESVTFDGRFHHIDHAGLLPRPIQSPIPIWMGGSIVAPVLDRIGRLADGWICNTPLGDDLNRALEVIYETAKRAGRAAPGLQAAARITTFDGNDLERQVADLRTLGVDHISINGLKPKRSPEEHIEIIKFAGEVLRDQLT